MHDDYTLEALISAVKLQEAIWNTKLKDYYDIEKKRNAWNVVCTQVIDNFNEKHGLLQNVIAQVLKKEWKILKYGYFRFATVKPNAKAHKHYAYRQQLSFLETIMHSRPDRNHISEVPNYDEDFTQMNKRKSSRSEEETESLSKRLRPDQTNDCAEEDRMFLLSLVRDFNKIDDQYKLDARSEIINVIKYYRGLPHPSNETECKNNSNSSFLSSRSSERRHHSSILIDEPLPTQSSSSSPIKRE